jgi:hypothetical protein
MQELLLKTLVVFGVLAWLPRVSAQPELDNFPDITFKVFSDFVQQQFAKDVSVKTVLIVLFSLTSNPDLLGLHACQQHAWADGEIRQALSGWIKVLSQGLQERLGEATETLFPVIKQDSDWMTNMLAGKLDGLSKLLNLDPYRRQGNFEKRLNSIDDNDIAPVRIICPISLECETVTC